MHRAGDTYEENPQYALSLCMCRSLDEHFGNTGTGRGKGDNGEEYGAYQCNECSGSVRYMGKERRSALF